MAELDYGLYPSQEMQMNWLKVYLQAYKLYTKNTEDVSQRELETLYVQVNKFALVRKKMLANTHSHALCLTWLDLTWYLICLPQGVSLLLGLLGTYPDKILLHRFWLPRVSVCVAFCGAPLL